MLTSKVVGRDVKQVRVASADIVKEGNNRWVVSGVERNSQRQWQKAFPSANFTRMDVLSEGNYFSRT